MSAVAKVAKPVMRGMHVNVIKKNLIVATAFSTVTSVAWYLGVNKPRKEAYKNFYATYDADKEFERMKGCGVFQSQAIIEEKMAEE
uniref:Cytochrome c oxidase subunit 6C-1-like isoform X1 n=1 Tax=Paracalanus parvus TaxID=187406 RepID=A0A0U2TIG5_9MAXI|nr:cytochrome c oxidase subunit 6C-1-like isoform X1 [Paracalanus parvus]